MCPCPSSGKGLTQLYLENIKDVGEFDKFVLGLFEKNMALEGKFESQLRRYNLGADEKMGTDTTETNRLSFHKEIKYISMLACTEAMIKLFIIVNGK